MRVLLLILSVLMFALPGLAVAQAEDDDRSRIVRFLESQLSGGARTVTIRGFRGALSSTAEMDLLTIADGQGVWLTLENARLTWSRSALLRGALEIDELTAESLDIARRPESPETGIDLPAAETTPFALPDLPVSIAIARTAIDRVSLGEDILGLPVVLSVEGSARLAGGEGAADLSLERQDGPRGLFDLDASYANESRMLDLSLLVEEEAGGIAASVLGLPDAPALRLAVEGTGPIDDVTATIALDSDGQPRLSGQVETLLDGVTGERRIRADLGGDITPLIASDYRGFFGPDVGLLADLRLLADGGVELDSLSLSAAALQLEGQLSLAPGGVPRDFDLSGRIADPAGDGPVLLPVGGAPITVRAVDLHLTHDAADRDSYTAKVGVTDLDLGTMQIARVALDASGRITQTADGVAVDTPLTLGISGIAHDDPALAAALGPEANIAGRLTWTEGGPLTLNDLVARAGDLGLSGVASLLLGENRLTLTTELEAEAADIGRFGPVTGQPLAGSLGAALDAEAELLSGGFDLSLTGTGRDLTLAAGLPPRLLAGETVLTLSARRDETGLTLREFALGNAEVSLAAEGRVSGTGTALNAEARLANIGLFTDALSGPVTATLEATRGPGENAPLEIASDVQSGAGITARLGGSVMPEAGTVDLTATGQLPLALANRALSPRSVSGTLGFDLSMRGVPSLDALSGQITTQGARVTLPTFQNALESVSATGRLSGGQLALEVGGTLATGGTLSATGTLGLSQPGLPVQIAVTGQALQLVDPTLYSALIERADITIAGALTGALQVGGTITLGETEVRIPESGLGGSASIPPITHFGESAEERRTRIAAGLGPVEGGPEGSQRIGLDLTITAPGRIFLRGRGLDAELGGTLRIGGTTANVIPSGRFELVRGRLQILGNRLDLTDGSASLEGNFDPFIRLLATSRRGGYTIGVNVIGRVTAPEISFTATPSLPEDEVLAQLLFGRSVAALSPVQALQMADAVASLAGGSSRPGLLGSLREGLGLDDLDVQTDDTGNAGLRAGRYLSENIYTDVTVTQGGTTGLSLNIDLTPDITARGTFESDGTSRLGVFFERDY
ncbi:translocation/assembly module TamB domain-containing protein [Roseicyclus marinus]|uniref:translocation/assembly module TamB domain-containing protein n=1 Tax=Roseicyclus marinus TaxID=2161673 RepID=UPI00240FDCCE|nr:translocation/assembly module TamB domain-containing protein [Roseicyclus marinus]MDG3041481.1 translocation/assembly module TamB domain-containing protein [Roseicyclus marinus]